MQIVQLNCHTIHEKTMRKVTGHKWLGMFARWTHEMKHYYATISFHLHPVSHLCLIFHLSQCVSVWMNKVVKKTSESDWHDSFKSRYDKLIHLQWHVMWTSMLLTMSKVDFGVWVCVYFVTCLLSLISWCVITNDFKHTQKNTLK